MFHNAEAVRTSLKKISIPGVFLSYRTPESFLIVVLLTATKSFLMQVKKLLKNTLLRAFPCYF